MAEETKLLDKYWAQFCKEAFADAPEGTNFDHERGIWFAGVVAVVAHVTAVRDLDAVVGRVGEIVKELEHIQKREMARMKPEQDVCYDGSEPLSP